jgi:Amiloride-sensitive sodium channel
MTGSNEKWACVSSYNTIFFQVMHTCEEMFTGRCWWRNRYYECCKLFVEQKSEFGICYAFNSAVNDVGFVLAVSIGLPMHKLVTKLYK